VATEIQIYSGRVLILKDFGRATVPARWGRGQSAAVQPAQPSLSGGTDHENAIVFDNRCGISREQKADAVASIASGTGSSMAPIAPMASVASGSDLGTAFGAAHSAHDSGVSRASTAARTSVASSGRLEYAVGKPGKAVDTEHGNGMVTTVTPAPAVAVKATPSASAPAIAGALVAAPAAAAATSRSTGCSILAIGGPVNFNIRAQEGQMECRGSAMLTIVTIKPVLSGFSRHPGETGGSTMAAFRVVRVGGAILAGHSGVVGPASVSS
jgi:hypothetical protein